MLEQMTSSEMKELDAKSSARWLNVSPPLIRRDAEDLSLSQMPAFLTWAKTQVETTHCGKHLDEVQLGFRFKGQEILCLIDIAHTSPIKPSCWFLVCDYNDKIEGPLEWDEENEKVSFPEFFNELSLHVLGEELPEECWKKSSYTQEIQARLIQEKLDKSLPFSSVSTKVKLHL